jgi:hypothetical protein
LILITITSMLTNNPETSQKKVDLFVNTDFSGIESGNKDDIVEPRDSNNYRFRTYVNGIVEIQNLQDFIIKLSAVTSLIVVSCPRLLIARHFLYKDNDNDNIVTIYLTVSLSEQILLVVIASYFIMIEDLDGIYHAQYYRNVVPNLISIGKIETWWRKHFSLLGIILATKFFIMNRCINSTYIYIFLFSMFNLGMNRLFQIKNLN